MLRRVTRGTLVAQGASLLAVCVLVPAVALADDHANVAAQATPLKTNGTATSGSIETKGDRDWFQFDALAGARYEVATSALSSGMDTVIEVHGPTGSLLAQDDDSGGGLASRAEVTPGAGKVTVLVRHYSSWRTGTYSVAVKMVVAPPTPPAPTPSPTTGAIAINAARVFDPKLAAATLTVATRVTGGAYQATLTVHGAGGSLVRTVLSNQARQDAQSYSDAWDGHDNQGYFVAPGEYGVRLTVVRGATTTSQEVPVSVVRLGARAIKFLDDAAGEPRAKLLYHRASSSSGSYFAIDTAGPSWTLPRSTLGDGALDDATGTPLADPAPWTNLAAPPRDNTGALLARGRSLPVAYRQGATPHVQLTLGDRAVTAGTVGSCGYPVSGVPIRVVCGGAPSGTITPGAIVTVELAALPMGIQRLDRGVDVRFQYQLNGTWSDVPGVQPTRHRIYTVLGPSRVSSPAGGLPWVAVLDQVATWSAGSAQDARGAVAAIVRGVNGSLGLTYDTVMGASAYAGGSLATPDFDLSAFVDRKYGKTINCSDCASAVSTYARQVGVDTEVAILGWNFDLNWIKGIGGTKFIHDLFGGYHAFSYHAVATIDGAQTLDDACLAVDDDSRPDLSPFVERLPLAMPFAHYRSQLTPGTFSVDSRGKTTPR